MESTVLVSYARTAFGKFGGALRDVPGVELAATAVGEPSAARASTRRR